MIIIKEGISAETIYNEYQGEKCIRNGIYCKIIDNTYEVINDIPPVVEKEPSDLSTGETLRTPQGIIDLGTLEYIYNEKNKVFSVWNLPSDFSGDRNETCNAYEILQEPHTISEMPNKSIEIKDHNTMYIKDLDFENGEELAKELSGKLMFYERKDYDSQNE